MNNKNHVLHVIEQTKIVPVVKIDNTKDTIPLLKAILEGGINVVEITFRTSCAQEAIKIAVNEFPDLTIGAGTVISCEQAQQAIDAKAEFLVSPGFDEKIAKLCNSKKLPYFGGCVTPTEIMKAIKNGCEVIKFFPSEIYGGLKAIKALSAPFPQVKFMPTGGINIDNLNEYLSSNKVFACGGSWMVKGEYIKAGNFEKIKQLCSEAMREAHKK